MPKSRNRPRPKQTPLQRRRWDWRRVAGGWGEYARNLSLVFIAAPFVEPLMTGAPVDSGRAGAGILLGIAFFVAGTIFDHERRD